MKILAVLLTMLLSGSALASKPYSVKSFMLLQPDSVLQERVGDVQGLANYVKSLDAAAAAALSRAKKPTPAAGFIVVAVRPNGQSKVWLDLSPALPPAVATQLRTSLERVPPFKARDGVVVFAINTTLWGSAPTERQNPWPAEWKKAMKGAKGAVEVGDLVDRVWPSKSGT